jgi:hypothetical protein
MRYLQAVPVLLLIAVAVNQIRLAHAADISPWKGGGFGMFASTDGGMNRNIRAIVTTTERTEEIVIPGAVADPFVRAKTLPSDARLESLGLALADYGESKGFVVQRIALQAWRVQFDAESLLPVKDPLAEYILEFE